MGVYTEAMPGREIAVVDELLEPQGNYRRLTQFNLRVSTGDRSLLGLGRSPYSSPSPRIGTTKSVQWRRISLPSSQQTPRWRKGISNSRSHPDGELSQRVVLVDICDGDTDGAPATTADRGTQLPTHLEAAAEEGILANLVQHLHRLRPHVRRATRQWCLFADCRAARPWTRLRRRPPPLWWMPPLDRREPAAQGPGQSSPGAGRNWRRQALQHQRNPRRRRHCRHVSRR
jgi:hypothetical protein